MARSKADPPTLDLPLAAPMPAPKVRRVPPATTGAVVTWRITVAVFTVILYGFVPPLRWATAALLAAARNLANGHLPHHGKPLSAGPWPHELVSSAQHGAPTAAGIAAVVVAVAVGLQVRGVRRYGPNAVIAKVAMWTAGSLVGVVVLLVAAVSLTDKPGDVVLGGVVNLLTSLAQFFGTAGW